MLQHIFDSLAAPHCPSDSRQLNRVYEHTSLPYGYSHENAEPWFLLGAVHWNNSCKNSPHPAQSALWAVFFVHENMGQFAFQYCLHIPHMYLPPQSSWWYPTTWSCSQKKKYLLCWSREILHKVMQHLYRCIWFRLTFLPPTLHFSSQLPVSLLKSIWTCDCHLRISNSAPCNSNLFLFADDPLPCCSSFL